MKKILLCALIFLLCQVTAFAAAKTNKNITLDFTLNYKIHDHGKSSEHTMKNSLPIKGERWHVAGKFQSNRNDEVVLFLVRLLSQRSGKFTFQFMIIDSDIHNTFVSEPKVTVMAGLPVQLTETGNGRDITLNTLVKLSSQPEKQSVTKVLQK